MLVAEGLFALFCCFVLRFYGLENEHMTLHSMDRLGDLRWRATLRGLAPGKGTDRCR